MDPLDLRRFAGRVETLIHTPTHGWHPADELEFKGRLPGGRDPRVLPAPETLRELAEAGLSPTRGAWEVWLASARRLEDLARDNGPRNPKRLMRDMARGKFPFGR